MFGGDDNNNAGGQPDNNDLQIPDGAYNADDAQATPADDGNGFAMAAPAGDAPKDDHNDDSPAATAPSGDNDALLDLKQDALKQLAPLVQHLDQSPEEKFRTTMMMIQASDDSSLLKNAYEAASAIADEKVKAQALLDVVNEINYFTQFAPAEK